MILLPLHSWAGDVTLGTRTSYGPNTFIEDVSGTGEFGAADVWNWDVDYAYTRSADPTTTTTSGGILVETTKDFRAGLGWDDAGWSLSGTGEYATTPDEDLTNTGVQFAISRRFKYSERNEAGFQPWWSMGLSLGGNSYRQIFNGTVRVTRKKTRPVTGENLLDQKSAKLDLKWRPIKPIQLKLSGTVYGYNRNVADFESFLNSTAAANRGMASLSGTVGGLPASQLGAGAKWYFASDWDLYGEYSRSILAADRSQSTVERLQLEWDPTEAWHFAAGTERDDSEGTTEWLTLFTAEFTF